MTMTQKMFEKANLEGLGKLTANHPVRWCAGFKKRNYSDLARHANVDDVRIKRAPLNTMEGVANSFILNAERAEQEAIRTNPPVYDRSYVERATYSIVSLYSDYKDSIEAKERTWEDYQSERKKWRQCKYKFCINMFAIKSDNFKQKPSKRKDSRYCCDECRKSDHDAIKRYKQTGSYLPVYFYLPELSESVGDKIRLHESATEGDRIERQINRNKPQRYAPIKKEKPPEYPVVTYNIADLTDNEIVEKGLQRYASNPLDSRRKIPLICRGA